MDTQTAKQETKRGRRDGIAFFHPNKEGTGAAARLEPKINRAGDDRGNCFFLEMAEQKTAASRNGGGFVPASFDWENKITVKLDFQDICHLLAVLEDRTEHAGGKRDGLYHQNGQSSAMIRLRKHESGGYLLGLSRKRGDEEEARRVGTVLSEVEAVGLRQVFSVGLFFMALPMDSIGTADDRSQNQKWE